MGVADDMRHCDKIDLRCAGGMSGARYVVSQLRDCSLYFSVSPIPDLHNKSRTGVSELRAGAETHNDSLQHAKRPNMHNRLPHRIIIQHLGQYIQLVLSRPVCLFALSALRRRRAPARAYRTGPIDRSRSGVGPSSRRASDGEVHVGMLEVDARRNGRY